MSRPKHHGIRSLTTTTLLMELGVSRQDFTMDEKNAGVMASIQETLRSMDLRKPTLSTLAQKGDGEVKVKTLFRNKTC